MYILFASLLWPLGLVTAQKAPCVNRSITLSVVRINGSNHINVLGTEFRGSSRGKGVIIKSVTLDGGPRRVVLLLDKSGSMAGKVTGDWNVLFDVAHELVDEMPADVQIALAFFADRLESDVLFTTNHDQILKALEKSRKLQTTVERKDAPTAMRDAINESTKMFGEPQFGDSVYIISDGYDNYSKIGSNALANELAVSGIRLFAFALLGKQINSGRNFGTGPVALQNLVSETGGFSVGLTRSSDRGTTDAALRSFALAPEELHEELRFQFGQIVEVFRLEVQLPDYWKRPEDWTLDWVGPDKSVQKDFLVVYPRILGPCR